ncbi:MAG: 50S ribosomal protein L13 [Phycisphaeraceae bacterium]|nr:50S ribosomal protein L13 [Phycisphaeraceae bacterium]
MNRQTTLANPQTATRQWLHVDATDQVLGRLAVRLATLLMGKHKPTYTPHCDVGDFVVVTNAAKVRLTGDKANQKFYKTFSGHPSGLKQTSYAKMLVDKPELLLEQAVRRMLPKNKLADSQINKLKIYAGSEHPHSAQNPQTLDPSAA